MFNWSTHKKYPPFWNTYQDLFKNKKQSTLETTRFVVFDTETTGLNIKEDRILSIGAIALTGNIIDVGDSLEVYLKQNTFNAETVKIHGILEKDSATKLNENEGLILFLEYIKDAILVAHHAAFDVAMINQSLARMGLPKLKNKILDTGTLFKKTPLCFDKTKQFSLDNLSALFNIKKHDRHTASGDAYITAIIFLKIIGTLRNTRQIKLKDLFFNSNRQGLL